MRELPESTKNAPMLRLTSSHTGLTSRSPYGSCDLSAILTSHMLHPDWSRKKEDNHKTLILPAESLLSWFSTFQTPLAQVFSLLHCYNAPSLLLRIVEVKKEKRDSSHRLKKQGNSRARRLNKKKIENQFDPRSLRSILEE